MRTYVRTSKNTGASFGLVGSLVVMLGMAAIALLVWACRVVGVIAVGVAMLATAGWRRLHA